VAINAKNSHIIRDCVNNARKVTGYGNDAALQEVLERYPIATARQMQEEIITIFGDSSFISN
jgi:hypothetical protein